MKDILIRNFIMPFIAGVLLIILGGYYQLKISNKDNEIIEIKTVSEVSRREVKDLKNRLQTAEVNFALGYETVVDKKKKYHIDNLLKYRKYLHKYNPVEVYLKNGNHLIEPRYNSSSRIPKPDLLASMKSACAPNNSRIGLFRDKDFYKLPVNVSIAWAEMLNRADGSCYNVFAGIKTLEEDSFWTDLGYQLIGVHNYRYELIEEHYNDILSYAIELDHIILDEIKILNRE